MAERFVKIIELLLIIHYLTEMEFQIFSELQYEVYAPTSFIFSIQSSRSPGQVIIEESLVIDPLLTHQEIKGMDGESRLIGLVADGNTSFTIRYQARVEVNYTTVHQPEHSPPLVIHELDATVMLYLFPSRYCQSDKLEKLANLEFGHIETAYGKVSAITEWIYKNVTYLPGTTNSNTSAIDTLTERVGVCRDFAHLAITFCRALHIPARYFTGYAYNLNPPDFHACFEAYIGGEWIFFDPTRLVPVNGLVKIANGRDAADAAVANIFGSAAGTSMIIKCECTNPGFKPVYFNGAENQPGLSYK